MPRKTAIISQVCGFADAQPRAETLCDQLATHVPGTDCAVFLPNFLNPGEADSLFSEALDRLPWQEEWIRIFGRRVRVPRRVAWQGDPGTSYRYSGVVHASDGWTPAFRDLRDRLQRQTGRRFNFLLANWYQHGSEYMGWHKDDEPGLASLVASISLGATRRFLLRETGRKKSSPLDLTHGSLLVFDGAMRHTLPKCVRAEPRINLTFRWLSGNHC